ncbi:L,D-transpeptidase [Fictibacillus aquaticus]|uniref:L,D-TPase catalytic domain-containing protein n=1 Tax=Fictibacillus aquaticus TaxID=2021314 RepID=A0A235F8U0_9BACL|nr:L,D-transpeptidase family protein [Fictibacillus aquaticus]OYD57730.1 hypothetical protein CGZ90_13805 [Fictibacillus aquaticus]
MKKIFLSLLAILSFGAFPGGADASTSFYKAQWESKLPKLETKRQVIVVTVPNARSYQAKLYTYEKMSDGKWRAAFPVMKAVVGKTGVSSRKVEGDGKSPTGKFLFGTAFGSAVKPSAVTWPYKKTTVSDFWVDDAKSSYYNKWVNTTKMKATWNSAEKLLQPLYKYAAVIRYNDDPIVKGKGSAIFLHVWKNEYSPTLGCTAVSEANLVKLLSWMNASKRPIIVVGTEAQVAGYITN